MHLKSAFPVYMSSSYGLQTEKFNYYRKIYTHAKNLNFIKHNLLPDLVCFRPLELEEHDCVILSRIQFSWQLNAHCAAGKRLVWYALYYRHNVKNKKKHCMWILVITQWNSQPRLMDMSFFCRKTKIMIWQWLFRKWLNIF